MFFVRIILVLQVGV